MVQRIGQLHDISESMHKMLIIVDYFHPFLHVKNQRRKLELNVTWTECEPIGAHLKDPKPAFILSDILEGARKDPRLLSTETTGSL